MSKTLEEMILEAMPYFPCVYFQGAIINTQQADVRDFSLVYKHRVLPSDSLIFFVPSQPSIKGTNNLVIKVPVSVDENDKPVYQDTSFTIVVETNEGKTRLATEGDIVAYRMCLFRFAKTNTNTIILTNSPSYNTLQVTNLIATHARFLNIPRYGENSLENVELATKVDTSEINEKIDKLEDKFCYGTEDPDEALAGKANGTIYIQVEEE